MDRHWNRRGFFAAAGCAAAVISLVWACPAARAEDSSASRRAPGKGLRAGAYAIDITPTKFPVIVSGGFLERKATKVHDPLHARCLVLDDGAIRVAIAVVDTCLMPRELLDRAKALAGKTTGIRADRILISATHTHTAPSVTGALGSGVEEGYARQLPGWIAKGMELAARNLAPAKVGWAVAEDFEHTNCRRWIRRPDRVGTDPFGQKTVRAMMHPGYQNPDYVGPAGPVDPDISMLSVRSTDGRPIALLANYSMHYFGAAAVSADYFPVFGRKFARLIGAEKLDPPFVAILSQGTSGDLHWMGYHQPRKKISLESYAEAVARVAWGAYKNIRYHDRAPLAMREKTLTLGRRVPDEKRLAWAGKIAAGMKGGKPRNKQEVYALEQIYLHKQPTRELKLQALRIGELGIVALPCEVFGITGLKIKAQSPLQPTFNIELANGHEGYIPPPEQHALGGYTTWPARSAALEVQAEPKIVAATLDLLEEVSGRPRRKPADTHGPYAKAVLASRPRAYWRMGELNGPRAADASGAGSNGAYEGLLAFYLRGPDSAAFCGQGRINRAVHFAGGRMKSAVKGLGKTYSVELWFWNGIPTDARLVTGYLFSRGVDGAKGAPGDHLGIGGTHGAAGKLFLFNGNARNQTLAGTTDIKLRSWNYVVLVRDGQNATVYLNGKAAAEISGRLAPGCDPGVEQVFAGGRSDNLLNFVGKVDEVAVYDRALTAEEMAKHHAMARE